MHRDKGHNHFFLSPSLPFGRFHFVVFFFIRFWFRKSLDVFRLLVCGMKVITVFSLWLSGLVELNHVWVCCFWLYLEHSWQFKMYITSYKSRAPVVFPLSLHKSYFRGNAWSKHFCCSSLCYVNVRRIFHLLRCSALPLVFFLTIKSFMTELLKAALVPVHPDVTSSGRLISKPILMNDDVIYTADF